MDLIFKLRVPNPHLDKKHLMEVLRHPQKSWGR